MRKQIEVYSNGEYQYTEEVCSCGTVLSPEHDDSPLTYEQYLAGVEYTAEFVISQQKRVMFGFHGVIRPEEIEKFNDLPF